MLHEKCGYIAQHHDADAFLNPRARPAVLAEGAENFQIRLAGIPECFEPLAQRARPVVALARQPACRQNRPASGSPPRAGAGCAPRIPHARGRRGARPVRPAKRPRPLRAAVRGRRRVHGTARTGKRASPPERAGTARVRPCRAWCIAYDSRWQECCAPLSTRVSRARNRRFRDRGRRRFTHCRRGRARVLVGYAKRACAFDSRLNKW